MCTGQAQAGPKADAVRSSHDTNEQIEQNRIERFPLGFVHDFGKVKYGTVASFTFPIANSTDTPLRIVSVRASSANHLTATMSKQELKPSEQGDLKITIDTRFFLGRKTTKVWLTMRSGEKTMETFVQVTAESIREIVPLECDQAGGIPTPP
jgi:hypothetical protein